MPVVQNTQSRSNLTYLFFWIFHLSNIVIPGTKPGLASRKDPPRCRPAPDGPRSLAPSTPHFATTRTDEAFTNSEYRKATSEGLVGAVGFVRLRKPIFAGEWAPFSWAHFRHLLPIFSFLPLLRILLLHPSCQFAGYLQLQNSFFQI